MPNKSKVEEIFAELYEHLPPAPLARYAYLLSGVAVLGRCGQKIPPIKNSGFMLGVRIVGKGG